MLRALNRRLINSFFKALSRELDLKARVVLTGAAAGNLMGDVRASSDIDFAININRASPQAWEKVEAAISKAKELTGLTANYAQDIDRWGLISLMDYLKHTLPYQQFGLIKVDILAPAYWSIGKMTRYLSPDIRDMVRVFKRRKIAYPELARTWGAALRSSPRSTALFEFRKHVEDFLRLYGRFIWGKTFDFDKSVWLFNKAAGIKGEAAHEPR